MKKKVIISVIIVIILVILFVGFVLWNKPVYYCQMSLNRIGDTYFLGMIIQYTGNIRNIIQKGDPIIFKRWLSSGMTYDDILTDFPELTRQDILACLAFAAQRERTLQYA